MHPSPPSFTDVLCLSECHALSELTLDGNPLANTPDYRCSILFHVSQLHSLDQHTVTVRQLHYSMMSL